MACRPTRRDTLLLVVGAVVLLFIANLYTPFKVPQFSPQPTEEVLVSGPLGDDLSNPPLPPPRNEVPIQHDEDFRKKVAPGTKTSLPLTRIVAHAPGWTIFENLYMSGGTLFIMTEEEEKDSIPEVRMMTSTGLPALHPDNSAEREPTKRDMDIIDPTGARQQWNGGVWGVDGTTVRSTFGP